MQFDFVSNRLPSVLNLNLSATFLIDHLAVV